MFLNGFAATVTQDGTGVQTIVGSPDAGGQFTVTGGTGTQWVWTGNADATVQAAATGTPGAALNVAVQAGSTSTLQLGGENAMALGQGGTLSITGAPTAGAAVTVFAVAGTITMLGGAENTVAVMDGGDLSLTAGGGSQQVFGQDQGAGTLTVMGSHSVSGGSQTVVDAAATIFGGNTAQQIWTGTADDTVVSSALPSDGGGSIALFVQGGTSAYWGGVETATVDDDGGLLDAFLRGGGGVSIGVDMAAAAGSTAVIQNFDPTLDTLILRGLPSAAALSVSTDSAGTTLSYGASHVLLADSTPLSGTSIASASNGTQVVFGHG